VSTADFVVIGAGIAGASVAYELQGRGRTVLLERERVSGYHTTGRSAAFVVESYGSSLVRALTHGGRGFLEDPPKGFAPHALVHPCPVLWIGREDQKNRLEAALEADDSGADLRRVSVDNARELCPVLREEYVACAVMEPKALSIDVAGLLDGFLRGVRTRGGEIYQRAGVDRIEWTGNGWEVGAGDRTWRTPVVVNAAGAWCDDVARLAGARPLGLRPLRRTAITFDPPPGADVRSWPCVIDADEQFYFKPEGARILASPCDETPSEPCDATPEDYDVAVAVDRVQRATTIEVKHVANRWAGLRTFAPDRSPVIGTDPERAGFFWLGGQGGFGIMTSPGAARAAAALIVDGALPGDLADLGLTPEDLSPSRPGITRRP
jgi:D-arginine dehydrogenase